MASGTVDEMETSAPKRCSRQNRGLVESGCGCGGMVEVVAFWWHFPRMRAFRGKVRRIISRVRWVFVLFCLFLFLCVFFVCLFCFVF